MMEDIVFNVTFTDSTVDKKAPIKIAPRTVDNSTSLRLHGRGSPSYGSDQWTNMVRLLENFCSKNVIPINPTEGQLWYNATTQTISIYTKENNAYLWKPLITGSSTDFAKTTELSKYLKLDGDKTTRTMVGSIILNRSNEFTSAGKLIPTDTIVGGNQNDAVSRSYVDTKVSSLVLPDITNLLDKTSTADQTLAGKLILNNQNLSLTSDLNSKVAATKGYVDAVVVNIGSFTPPTGLSPLGNGVMYSNATSISYSKGNSNDILSMNSAGTGLSWKPLPTQVTLPTGLVPIAKGVLYGSSTTTLAYSAGSGLMIGTDSGTFAINYLSKGTNNSSLTINNSGNYEWQSIPSPVTLPTGLSPVSNGLLFGSSSSLTYKSGDGIIFGSNGSSFDVNYIAKGAGGQSLYIKSDASGYEWKTPVSLPNALSNQALGILYSDATNIDYTKGDSNTALVMNSGATGFSWLPYLPAKPADNTKKYNLQLELDGTYAWVVEPSAVPTALTTPALGIVYSDASKIDYTKGLSNTALVMNSNATDFSWLPYLPSAPADNTKKYSLQLGLDGTYSWIPVDEAKEVVYASSGTTNWHAGDKLVTINGQATATATTLANGSVYYAASIDFGTPTSLTLTAPYNIVIQSGTPLLTLSTTDINYDATNPGKLFGVTSQPQFNVVNQTDTTCVVECVANIDPLADATATPVVPARWDVVPAATITISYTITGQTASSGSSTPASTPAPTPSPTPSPSPSVSAI
jgi:hypothetical protein